MKVKIAMFVPLITYERLTLAAAISSPIEGLHSEDMLADRRHRPIELLLFAGGVATLLRLTGLTRGHIVSLKMEGILFQGILAGVIRCYQQFQVFFAHLYLLPLQ
jgi:hypothetical protein